MNTVKENWNGVDRRQGHPNLAYLRQLTESLTARDSQVREDLDKFRAIANFLPVGIWCCDKDGYADYVNETWANWSGMTMSQCLGNGWVEGIALEDRERTWKIWSKCVAAESNYRAFYRVVNRSTGAEKKCFALGKKINTEHWVGITIDLDEIGGVFYESRE